MEGLLKLFAIIIVLYLFGWLGKRGNRWVEDMATRAKKLFCEKSTNSKPK